MKTKSSILFLLPILLIGCLVDRQEDQVDIDSRLPQTAENYIHFHFPQYNLAPLNSLHGMENSPLLDYFTYGEDSLWSRNLLGADFNADGMQDYALIMYHIKDSTEEGLHYKHGTLVLLAKEESYEFYPKDFPTGGAIRQNEVYLNHWIGIVPPGTYKRGYPYHDDTTINNYSIGYSVFECCIGASTWMDGQFKRINFYAD